MPRDFRFDIARAVCMCYIIAVLHLSQYFGLQYYIYGTYIGRLITFSCLGLFTFMSGYLIGKKNDFTSSSIAHIFKFYKKRFIRIYPLFFLATLLLYIIGFNGLIPSVYGLLGIASFVVRQPKTLWYVSMLIIFYLLTPLINRNSLGYKTIISGLIVMLFGFLKLFIQVDARFIFNLFFYCLGLIMATVDCDFLSKTDGSNQRTHLLTVFFYVTLILITNRFFSNSITMLAVGALGVAALFSLSCLLSKIKNQSFEKTVGFVSYASMVCYMFHRFFYWCGLEVFTPESLFLKAVYLVFVFVLGLVISYFVQKGYDRIVSNTKNSNR